MPQSNSDPACVPPGKSVVTKSRPLSPVESDVLSKFEELSLSA